jgi:intron-binding protein aquarius
VREDVVDVLGRVGARWDMDDQVQFGGWARMAQPISTFKIAEVRKPNVGENKPAGVTAEVLLDTSKLRWAGQKGCGARGVRPWAGLVACGGDGA